MSSESPTPNFQFGIWVSFVIWNLSFVISLTPLCAQEKPYDYVIKDALVFDGESVVPAKQDLALLGDRIIQVGEVAREDGKEVIEAEGLVASPGFIDSHTHSDFNPFVYPNLGNKVLQGVTTEVVGNCGMSAAPIEGGHGGQIADIWRREGVEIPKTIPWKSFEDYVNETEFQGLETNFAGLAGHGNLRSAVMGMAARPAQPEEIESMKKLLREALNQGALGISFGLTYVPGIFATPEELAALCGEAAREKKICAFHLRSEGKHLLEAIREAIEVGRKTGARTHISHLKASGKKNWPKISEAFRLIEEAQAEGLRVTADAYPYAASFAELGVVLPDELYQDPNRIGRLQDPAQRAEILAALKKHYEASPVSWDRVRVATVTTEKNFPFQGKSILEISQTLNKPPVETILDLLAEEEFKVSAFYFSQSEAVVDQVLSKPYVAAGSDSIADGSAMPHPRAFGTFAQLLSRCLKQEEFARNRCWGRTIHQMTAFPAEIFGLKDRGRIANGFMADLVLFDPLRVKDRADYDHPKNPPEGIRWVFVNGKPLVQEGKYQPVHSGLFIAGEK